MKRLLKVLITGLLVVCVSVTIASSQEGKKGPQEQSKPEVEDSKYIIGPEDVLAIDVWKEPTLSKTVPVRMDGKISLPLIDEVTATGLTPLQLKEILIKKWKEFIDDPVVSVVVTQANSYKVYVSGYVQKPGVYTLGRETTILQIIPLVGGFTEWANQQKIIVIRREDGKEKRMTINYKKIIKGDDPDSNIVLKPGDTVIVP